MQYNDPQQEFPPFEINYFVAHFKQFKHNTLQYRIHVFEEVSL
jgi:hypothetical protein